MQSDGDVRKFFKGGTGRRYDIGSRGRESPVASDLESRAEELQCQEMPREGGAALSYRLLRFGSVPLLRSTFFFLMLHTS